MLWSNCSRRSSRVTPLPVMRGSSISVKRLGGGPRTDGEADGVTAGHGRGTVGRFGTGGTRPRAGVAQVPGEAVHAGGLVEARGAAAEAASAAFTILVGRGFDFHGRRFRSAGARAGEFADDFARARRGSPWRYRRRARRRGSNRWRRRAADTACVAPRPPPPRGRRADGLARLEEERGGDGGGIVGLVQRRQVVENPEGAALCGHDQILVRHLDIGDGRVRQIELEALPVRAVIEGNVHAEFGAGVEQAGAVGIFAHHARGLIGGDAVLAVGEQRPGLAEIVGAVDEGREIAQQEAIDGGVRGAGFVRCRVRCSARARRAGGLWA